MTTDLPPSYDTEITELTAWLEWQEEPSAAAVQGAIDGLRNHLHDIAIAEQMSADLTDAHRRIAELEAEVQKQKLDALTRDGEYQESFARLAELEAEIQRLRKAGFAMVNARDDAAYHEAENAWVKLWED